VIGCFPDPYPDEILYSVCARYKERMMFSSQAQVLKELFYVGISSLYLDQPAHLEYLASELPCNNYPVHRLVQENTLVPFFSAFLDKDFLRIRESNIHRNRIMHASKIIFDIPTPKYLRFCPMCNLKDKAEHGESYWHRLHQIAGVEVCPVHKMFLEESTIKIYENYAVGELRTADKALNSFVEFISLDVPQAHRSMLLNISKDAMWLINHGAPTHSKPECLRERYFSLLRKNGYVENGNVKKALLWKKVLRSKYKLGDFYHFLFRGKDWHPIYTLEDKYKLLPQEEKFYNFFDYFISHPENNHPIRHLTMIHLLGSKLKNFFEESIAIPNRL
jgi:hypothetical protein